MTQELHSLGVCKAAALIAAKSLSCVELTQHYLARIDAFDPRLNAFATVTHELALSQAKQAEAEILGGRHRGPLHGVPIAVKDIFDTRGIPTAAGMAIHKDRVPAHDATVIERLRAAGAVLLGKTNLTEGVYGEHRPPFGAPVNPWNADFWPGASSSGSAVAVAAGLCAAALGSETGGSIRLPCAANGVTGLKPTWGRVSRHGVFELAATLDHVGPIARTAGDSAAMLGAIAGADPRDPTASQQPVPDYIAATRDKLEGIRIGIDTDWIDQTVDAATLAAFNAATGVLRDVGAQLLPVVMPDVTDMIMDWFPICAVQTALAHAATFPSRRAEYGPALASLLDLGNALTGTEYQALILKRETFAGRVTALFNDVDLIAMPVLSFPTPSAERMELIDDDLIAGIHRFTCPFNLSRHPGIVLRCGVTTDNTPIVFQLIAPHFAEAPLIGAGAAFQAATTWHVRQPDLQV